VEVVLRGVAEVASLPHDTLLEMDLLDVAGGDGVVGGEDDESENSSEDLLPLPPPPPSMGCLFLGPGEGDSFLVALPLVLGLCL
jgi:hypothetical protein